MLRFAAGVITGVLLTVFGVVSSPAVRSLVDSTVKAWTS